MNDARAFPPLPPGERPVLPPVLPGEGWGEGKWEPPFPRPSPQPSPGGTGGKTTPHKEDSLLDPKALAQLGNLELIARRAVSGYMQGRHPSPHLDFALDFAQHRPYVAGDDIRRIDWRAFARNERYYVKQQQVSTNLRAQLLLDGSGSMAYQGESDAMSKFRYAQCVAASLAYLVLRQQDSAGLITFDHTVREVLPPSSAPSQLTRLVRVLEKSQPQGESGLSAMLGAAAGRFAQRSLVVVISDLFDDTSALVDSLHHLRRKRHEVILLHVMAADELRFPFRQWVLFEDLESPRRHSRLDPAVVREMYLHKLNEHLRAIRSAAAGLRMSYVLLDTSRPFAEALSAYLATRR